MQDTYQIGDEIRLKTGPETYLFAVVTNVDNDWITAFLGNGRNTQFKIGYASWRKTGRNFDEVKTLLLKIGGCC